MAPLDECQHPGYAQENCVEETVVTFDKMVTDELLKSYVQVRFLIWPHTHLSNNHRLEKVWIKPEAMLFRALGAS